MANKFEKILKSYGPLQKIQCDEGSEFQTICKELSENTISVFHTYNRDIKASHVERVIGTLKTMTRHVLTLTDSFHYYSILPLIIKRYNNSPHSSLGGFTPYQIYRDDKKETKMKSISRKMLSPATFTKDVLKEGTLVCIIWTKNYIFEKSSLRRWTNEKFLINKVFITGPTTYELSDLNKETIKGIFYREELQKQ